MTCTIIMPTRTIIIIAKAIQRNNQINNEIIHSDEGFFMHVLAADGEIGRT